VTEFLVMPISRPMALGPMPSAHSVSSFRTFAAGQRSLVTERPEVARSLRHTASGSRATSGSDAGWGGSCHVWAGPA
jgi:hypothetical protein